MQPPNRQAPRNRRANDATQSKLPVWDAAVSEFLREKKRANVSQSTLNLYGDCLSGKRAVEWRNAYGVEGTADITRETLRSFQIDLQGASLSPSTVHIYHRVMKTFVRWCREEGYEIGDRADMVTAPATPMEIPEPFTKDEEKRLLAAASPGRDRFLLEFLLGTGLRRAEVCGLLLDDVMEGPEGTWLRVRAATAKGRKPRTVPLDSPSQRLSRSLSEYVSKVRPATGTPNVFLSNRRDDRGEWTPLTIQIVKMLFFNLSKRTGIAAHAHRCRHTFATRAVASGVDVLTLQRVLGHSTTAMTARYYHDDPSALMGAWMRRRD